MRKNLIDSSMYKAILFLFAMFCLISSSYAAPCYGPRMPQEKDIFIGVQTHTIFKRYLENEYGKLRSSQHFLLLSYGVFDWLCLDLKGGAGNIKQHPLGGDENDYASGFDGGYGLRWKFLRQENLEMVLGFQHISVHPGSAYLPDGKNQAILDDWQTSLLASYNFKKITPYLGIRLSRVDYIHKIEGNRKRRMSDLTRGIGFIYGLDLPFTEKIWLNLEGSAFDSDSFAFSLNYSF
ncbi:MAG: hypothetical protein V2A64_06150 [Candidatus Omnitrophota bacterium]